MPHWSMRRALMLMHEPLSHLDGSRLAIFCCAATRAAARKPPAAEGSVPADLEEQGGQRRAKPVGVNPTRYAWHVRDVLRAGAGEAGGRAGSIV